MTNLERFNEIFADIFKVDVRVLDENFNRNNIDGWDSVKQLSLTSAIEDSFDLLLDAEDILGFTSYIDGKNILKKYIKDL